MPFSSFRLLSRHHEFDWVSAESNTIKPKHCLSSVFNSKLGRFCCYECIELHTPVANVIKLFTAVSYDFS